MSGPEKMDIIDSKCSRPSGLGWRHVQTLLLFAAMLLAFMMRVNMSMAIVAMTDPADPAHFEWSGNEQAQVLSSYFWGYVVLQVPGGELAARWGGKALIATSIASNAALSLLVPAAASAGGWRLVCACRVLQGLTQAFVYPSMHHLVSQWVPREEKGILTTIIYAGGQLGIAIQLLVSGFLAAAFGWPAIFYVNGIIGALWTVAYLFLGAGSPEQCRFISKAELSYIQRSLGREGQQKRYPTPWRSILSCVPFWAVVVAHCGQNWGFFTLMTEMPTYLAKVHNVNLTSNGVLSSLPYLAMYALSFPMGACTDLILRRNWLRVSTTRKLFNTIGLWGPALALLALAWAPADRPALAVALLALAVGVNAGQYTGYMLVHMDLAPNFSASLMGVTNCLANLTSIVAPLVCGAIVSTESTEPLQWRKVFYLASSVYFATNLFFLVFSTSRLQPWNDPSTQHLEAAAPSSDEQAPPEPEAKSEAEPEPEPVPLSRTTSLTKTTRDGTV